MSSKRTVITAALLYANGPVHIGHLAGCYIPADIYARYLRSKGQDVIFVTGSDEHGVPITIKAEKEGITPQQVVDKYHKMIKDTFQEFGISPDIYSRTSNPVHHETSQDFFKNLYNKGSFTELETEQFFDESANKFLADRYIIGTCPVCANENAYGDQCEKCGSTLSPDELINPHSALSGLKPIKKTTKNWYLPLDEIQETFLNSYIESHSNWKANVFGQCKSWLKEGLKPRAMTRDLDWGVSLPIGIPDTEGKVLYVWFDAPIGYISMTKELFSKSQDADYQQKYNVGFLNSKDERWKNNTYLDYWKNDENNCLVHFIGKDNIVFHGLIFPAMCHEHGGLQLADEIPANEFLNLEGNKISTSRNWAVWAHEYLIDFPDKQDALRYFLTSNAPETKDNNFTWKDFQTANNSELVGILGNFVNRVLVLTDKYYEGKVPAKPLIYSELSQKYVNIIQSIAKDICDNVDKFKFRDALACLIDLARNGNKMLADTEPWKLVKTNPVQTEEIMYVSIQITGALALLMEPFMPFTSQKLFHLLNIEAVKYADYELIINQQKDILLSDHQLNKPALLFEKIEDDAIEAQIIKLKGTLTEIKEEMIKEETSDIKQVNTQKPDINFEDFAKLDIRVGTILEAEKVEKADKLLKLKIDTGIDVRTVVSGIALHFVPEEIIGKQVSILVNLAPKKLKGIESQGMILMAENEDGKLVFISPNDFAKNGAEIR
ncbi:MAG: methionine--tRNA ligase [Cytophagales bacterium]